jgi:hypothetical protein
MQRPFAGRRQTSGLVIAIAGLAAAYFTLVYYPGILYSDSYVRWQYALGLWQGRASTFFSIGPSLWMAATYGLTENFAAYTVLQSFLFFLSILLLVRRAAGVEGWWLLVPAVALVSLPLYGGYSVFHEAGIGATVAMNFLLLLLSTERAQQLRTLPLLADGALLLFVLFNLFAYRQNALTLLPPAIYLLWRAAGSRVARLVRLGALVGAVALVQIVPRVLPYSQQDASGISFAWEIARTLQRLHAPEYSHFLDDYGNTEGALRGRLDDDIWSGLFGPDALDYAKIGSPSAAAQVKQDYLRLARAEPLAVLATKWDTWMRVVGIGRPLFFFEFDENRWNRLQEFGGRQTSLRHRSFERVGGMMSAAILRTPWAVFLVGIAATFAGIRLIPAGRRVFISIIVFAAFYYSAFLVTAPAYEFRYFFPAFCLVSTVVLALVTASVQRLGSYGLGELRRKRQAPSPPAPE